MSYGDDNVPSHRHWDSDLDGVAPSSHEHYDLEHKIRDLESLIAGLREDLGAAVERIHDLEGQVWPKPQVC